jgi:hypothetical protein
MARAASRWHGRRHMRIEVGKGLTVEGGGFNPPGPWRGLRVSSWDGLGPRAAGGGRVSSQATSLRPASSDTDRL